MHMLNCMQPWVGKKIVRDNVNIISSVYEFRKRYVFVHAHHKQSLPILLSKGTRDILFKPWVGLKEFPNVWLGQV